MLHNITYDTYPMVIHCPGKLNPDSWQSLLDIFFQRAKRNFGPVKDATIITWNNGEKGLFERSLDHIGVPYIVLGKNVKNWKNPIKIELTNRAFHDIKTKFVIGIDSHDAIICKDPNEIISTFTFSFPKVKMLFNCGPVHHPPVNRSFFKFQERIGLGHDFRHLNSGAWAGETEFCKMFFESCINSRQFDENPMNGWWDLSDQMYIKSTFPQYHPKVQLDYTSEIFQILPNINVIAMKKMFL